jgi:hypothetical protein
MESSLEDLSAAREGNISDPRTAYIRGGGNTVEDALSRMPEDALRVPGGDSGEGGSQNGSSYSLDCLYGPQVMLLYAVEAFVDSVYNRFRRTTR